MVEERLNTYIETKPLRLANNGQDLIFWSERTAGAHYYLYDAEPGALKNPLTSGEYVTTGIDGVDEKARVAVLFRGRPRKRRGSVLSAPLSRQLRRRGRQAARSRRCVARGDADRIDRVLRRQRLAHRRRTVSRSLYDTLGNVVMKLEKPDLSALIEAGFKFPEPFKVKADDGVTDLYGVMYKPFDFDPIEEIPDHRLRLPGPADRERDQDVQSAQQQHRAGAVRVHRHRGRQPRRQPAAVEVVPQLRLRQSARLRPGRQEGGDRAAGEAPFLHRHRHASASGATRAAGS